jgi:hypothetical protein
MSEMSESMSYQACTLAILTPASRMRETCAGQLHEGVAGLRRAGGKAVLA